VRRPSSSFLAGDENSEKTHTRVSGLGIDVLPADDEDEFINH
jgi:hypothetical protein